MYIHVYVQRKVYMFDSIREKSKVSSLKYFVCAHFVVLFFSCAAKSLYMCQPAEYILLQRHRSANRPDKL